MTTVAPKSISEIAPAERYKLAVADEVIGASAKTDANATHTKALRGVDGLAAGEDSELLKQTVETFFQPTMPAHERLRTAKELLRSKATELGYENVNQLRKALGEALAGSTTPLDVASYLQTLERGEAIEVVMAAMLVRSSVFDGAKVAEHVATHLGLSEGLADIQASAEKLHVETWANLGAQERIDLALDKLGKHVVPSGAATVGELGNTIAPVPVEELHARARSFGKRERAPGGGSGPDRLRGIFASAGPAPAEDLPARARFKQLPLNEQYQAILGTVALRSFGSSPNQLHEQAEKIFETMHPHRGESADVRRARRIDASRTFLAPGRGDAEKEKQMLGIMQKRATACALENVQDLMQVVTAMAYKPASLDAELFNTEPTARIQALAASVALTQEGVTSAQRATATRHAKQMAQSMFMETGQMMRFSLMAPEDGVVSAPPTAAEVAERLGERLTALGLPRDEAIEKAAVEALYAPKDYAETTRLARATMRDWTKSTGLRFTVDVIEAMAAAAAPTAGPPLEEEEPESPLEMLRGAREGKEVEKKKSFTSEIPSRPVEEILAEIKSFAGWDDAKDFVNEAMLAIEYDTFCREAGLPSQFQLQHLILKGPPGTGKTTFAKLYAELLHASGLLPANQVTRAKATDMVSRFLGGTAHDTQKILDAALGGVLFIDEIYRLARVHQYGQEAIDAINEFLDEHRDEFVCVVTGYTDETNDFLERNPGLKDRFGEELFFPAFTMETMLESVERLANDHGNTIHADAWPAIKEAFGAIDMDAKDFASGRTARKMFEEWQKHLKVRVVPEARAAKAKGDELTEELLKTIRAADIINRAPVVTKKNPIGYIWPTT